MAPEWTDGEVPWQSADINRTEQPNAIHHPRAEGWNSL
jgi:hypothetical protein